MQHISRAHRSYLLKLVVLAALVSSIFGSQNAVGAAQSLPPMPSNTVLHSVIQQAGSPAFTTLGVPSFMTAGLTQFTMAPFAGINYDSSHVVHYIDMASSIRQTVLPRLGAASMTLAPNTTSPGDNKPAMVIGGYYDTTVGVAIILATWKDTKPDSKIDKLRFYTVTSGQLSFTTPYAVAKNKFKGKNGQETPGDVGVLIATNQICLAIGLDQVCFESKPPLRDSSIAPLVDQARNATASAYQYNANFNHSEAVPDLVGANYRSACANTMGSAGNGNNRAGCAPDIIITASDKPTAGQPMALFNVLAANDLKAFDVHGTYVGQLPAGYYLVLDATPTDVSPDPGTITLLFLVNSDTQHHYLIPSQVIEGFATGGKQVAAIKDGTCSARRF